MVLKDDSAVVCSFLNIFLVTVGSESPLLNTAGGVLSYYKFVHDPRGGWQDGTFLVGSKVGSQVTCSLRR